MYSRGYRATATVCQPADATSSGVGLRVNATVYACMCVCVCARTHVQHTPRIAVVSTSRCWTPHLLRAMHQHRFQPEDDSFRPRMHHHHQQQHSLPTYHIGRPTSSDAHQVNYSTSSPYNCALRRCSAVTDTSRWAALFFGAVPV